MLKTKSDYKQSKNHYASVYRKMPDLICECGMITKNLNKHRNSVIHLNIILRNYGINKNV